MKVVILAGGLGSRLAEETETKPKPMIEIGGWPLLSHIMWHFRRFGFSEFLILSGYKSEIIERYYEGAAGVTVLHTGETTMTGGRLLRAKNLIGEEPFFLTYGDGLSDINLENLLIQHGKQGATVTLTAVRPESRFGLLDINEKGLVRGFSEKPLSRDWINGGFFVCGPGIFALITGDETVFEREPLERLARFGFLAAHKHEGFWQCMDTLRDKRKLEFLWKEGKAPWLT